MGYDRVFQFRIAIFLNLSGDRLLNWLLFHFWIEITMENKKNKKWCI